MHSMGTGLDTDLPEFHRNQRRSDRSAAKSSARRADSPARHPSSHRHRQGSFPAKSNPRRSRSAEASAGFAHPTAYPREQGQSQGCLFNTGGGVCLGRHALRSCHQQGMQDRSHRYLPRARRSLNSDTYFHTTATRPLVTRATPDLKTKNSPLIVRKDSAAVPAMNQGYKHAAPLAGVWATLITIANNE